MPSQLVQRFQLNRTANKAIEFVAQAQGKISLFLTLLFIALSAWIVGQLAWGLAYQDQKVTRWTPIPVSSTSSSGANSQGQQQAVTRLLDAHLFGRYSQQTAPKPVAAKVVDAPKTRLNLVLVGAVASRSGDKSLAVVANRGKQNTYGIGETIDGTRAVLKVVMIDRVIIENQGQDETLMLEGVKYSKLSESQQQQNTQASGTKGLPAEQLEQIRREITQNPQQIMQYIRLSQVKKDGRVMGYRVGPGKNRELFDSVGLKQGDIATRINGADLSDPAAMGKIWQSISELTELNLTVERNGQQHDIFIEF
ncbi:type II secretion system protein GspC [Vibrio tapetis]|uniref:Type II secretion system protein C n=1 Tax=Vibrio tapetis subsp. tapetis TaxID=1671868 RepID=A0A2N8ZGU5_9VIBR|nr:type II secretion system protein GspC [Vibrio tapetis]SON51085.1 Type II secretion system protein C [Vibrio tapetis subsp. tapetis]